MTQREYAWCEAEGFRTLGQKIGFIGRLIHSQRPKKNCGGYGPRVGDPARIAKITRLRELQRKLQIRLSCK